MTNRWFNDTWVWLSEPADRSAPYKTLRYAHLGQIETDICVRMIRDSVSEYGHRLTTMELTYWLMVHQDQQTHRTLWKTDDRKFEEWLDAARSSSSNRALAPARIDTQVRERPYVPLFVNATKSMVADEYLTGDAYAVARDAWLRYRDRTLASLAEFDALPARVHKQQFNRARSPFQLITTVMTGNEEWWRHFFTLRDHDATQPDLAVPAGMARWLFEDNEPRPVRAGEWHAPYVTGADLAAHRYDPLEIARISAARCARVSYLRQDAHMMVRDDLRLYDDLSTSVPAHDAPREHVATPIGRDERSGCYVGWTALRHFEVAV